MSGVTKLAGETELDLDLAPDADGREIEVHGELIGHDVQALDMGFDPLRDWRGHELPPRGRRRLLRREARRRRDPPEFHECCYEA